MTPRPDDSLFQQGNVCPSHNQFEARMEERFDVLKEGVDRVSDKQDSFNDKLDKIVDALGSGAVTFAGQDGRIKALEKNANECATDRDKMKCDIRFLTRGYWMAAGIFIALEVLLKLWK